MPDQDLVKKVANIPLAQPGFDALGMTAPVMVQVNPNGKWEKTAPENMDEDKLKKIVEYLIKTKAVSAAQSYCCQCCAENQKSGGDKANNYVPIIMMPILPADQCPFDMDCEQKQIEVETKEKKKTKIVEATEKDKAENEVQKKQRGFVMQRLNDFDLLSQW